MAIVQAFFMSYVLPSPPCENAAVPTNATGAITEHAISNAPPFQIRIRKDRPPDC